MKRKKWDRKELEEIIRPPAPETIEVDDFFLIKFGKNKSIVHYMGKVI